MTPVDPDAPDGPFIGRHLELEVLQDQLKSARAGKAGLVLIEGAPGVGKSRLLAQTIEYAERLGFRVLAGRADEFDRGVAYAALRDALGPALVAEEHPLLAEMAAEVRSVLVEPRPADLAGEVLGTDVGSLQPAFAVGEQLLRAWADRDPVLLVIDDLHAADSDTITAISLWARTLRDTRILIVAALRGDPPDLDIELSALIERLATLRHVTVIGVDAFDIHDVRALLTVRLDAQPDDDLVETVVDQTRGNPFFVEELLRAYADADAITIHDGKAQVASGVEVSLSTRAALLHRVFSLGKEVRAVARVMTAFVRFTLDRTELVASLVDLDVAEVEQAFDALVRARILQPVGDQGYDFAHPIVRSTLDDDLGPAERRRLHGAIAARMLDDRASGRLTDPIELALHVSRSAVPGDAEAASVLAEAGTATSSRAPRSAADWFERAIGIAPADDQRVGAWYASKARALFLAQMKVEAAVAAREAVSRLPSGSDRDRAAAVLTYCLSSLGETEEALRLTGELLEADPGHVRLRLERTALLVQLDRFDEAEVVAREAIAMADGDRSEALALSSLSQVEFGRGNVNAAVAIVDDVAARFAKVDAVSALGALVLRASHLAYGGFPDRALDVIADVEQRAASFGGAAFRTAVDPAAVWALSLRGDWDEALERADLATAEFERSGELFLLGLMQSMAAMILLERGQASAARGVLDRHPSRNPDRILRIWVSAGIELARERFDEARALLVDGLAAAEKTGRRQIVAHLRERLVAVALAAGEEAAAAAQLASLDALAADARATPWTRCLALRGRAMATGDVEAAIASRNEALGAGLRFDAWVSALLLGELTEDDDGDDLVRDAYLEFRSLGAEPWRRRAAAELRRRGVGVPRRRGAGRTTSALTDTERQLSRLVTDGLTNRQIAASMHLSPKTIEVYLSRLYAKAGVASRVELAVAVESGAIALD